MTAATIRRTALADAQTVIALWNEAAEWLRHRGHDQWQYPIKDHNIRSAIAAQNCWLVEHPSDKTVGTVTLDVAADPALWNPSDNPDDALYLHRLVVRTDLRGQNIGSAVIDWASTRAQVLGKSWLRLDAWTNNTQLHHYYLHHGFTLVRIVRGPGIESGALFERPAGTVLGLGPAVHEQD